MMDMGIMTNKVRIEELKRGHRKHFQDIDFYAKSMVNNRFVLTIDTAGGYWTTGCFSNNKKAIKYKNKYYRNRKFTIYDSFKSIPKETLIDRLEYLRLIGYKPE